MVMQHRGPSCFGRYFLRSSASVPEVRHERPLAFLVTLGLVFGAAAGVGAYPFTSARGGSYLTNNPDACVNCHVMREQYDGWVKSSHRAVAVCNDCHTPPGHVSRIRDESAERLLAFVRVYDRPLPGRDLHHGSQSWRHGSRVPEVPRPNRPGDRWSARREDDKGSVVLHEAPPIGGTPALRPEDHSLKPGRTHG